jgi:hypothetical protein
LSQVVNNANTTTALTSSVNPSAVNQSVTFTATVAAVAPGTGTPSGIVVFLDGATVLGTPTTNGSGVATLTTSSLTAGSHSITATYSASGNYNGSSSSPVSQSVLPVATTAVTSSANPAYFGQSVTFTATVSPNTATGTVTFKDGSTTLGTGTLDGLSGQTTYTTSALTVTGSPHSITAVYGGDSNYVGSTSPALSQAVNKAGTITTITSDLSTATVAGQSYTVAFTVGVNGPGSGSIPGTENVTVSDGAANCTATVSVGSCSLTSTTPGAKTITATYAGDTNFGNSAGTQAHQVGIASTTTTLSPLSASVFGQSVTFTATVTVNSPGSGTAPAGGTVTFLDGTTTLGTGTTNASGMATYATSALTVAGSPHNITAAYGGTTSYATSTSLPVQQVVNQANTTTTLTSSLNPAAWAQSVTFTATVSAVSPGSGHPSGEPVAFWDGGTSGTLLGTANTNASGMATYSTSSLSMSPPNHSITAVYSDDSNFIGSTSSAVSQTINKATTTTTVVSSKLSTVFGESMTFTATVTPSVATGTVQFKDGGVNLGDPVTLSAGVATYTPTTALSVASHSITAVYSDDADYTGSTSTAITQVVNKAATTTTITNDLTAATIAGQAYTVAFTVAVNSPGIGTIPGTDNVTVSDGTGASCTGTVADGSCSLTSTTGGLKSVTATYAGSTNFSASPPSAGVSHPVNQAPTFSSLAGATFVVNTAGTFNVTATGYPSTMTYSATGLPNGVSLNSSTGMLNGTVTQAAVYPIVITASNGISPDTTQNFSLTVMAPVTLQTSNSATFTGTSGSISLNLTGAPSSNTMLLVGIPIGSSSSSVTVSSVTWGGTALTLVPSCTANSSISNDAHVEIWSLANPSPINSTVAITISSSQTVYAGATLFANVASLGTCAKTSGSYATSASVTLTLPAGGAAFDSVAVNTTTTVTIAAPQTGQTSLWNHSSSTSGGAGSWTTTLATMKQTWNNGTDVYAYAAVPLTPGTPPPYSSTFTVSGSVIDSATSTGVPGASISIYSDSGLTNLVAGPITSAADGTWSLGSLADSMDLYVVLMPPSSPPYAPFAAIAGTGTANAVSTSEIHIVDPAYGGTSTGNTFKVVAGAPLAPQFTSAASTTFTVGSPGLFTVAASGNPQPTLSATGTLPSGVTFTASTGVLTGTPAAGTGGTYTLTITASNGIPPNAQQTFTLTVNQAPAITSANATTFLVNQSGTFTFTATGNPAPTFSESGTLPGTVQLSSSGVLSGTASATGTYQITVTASNVAGSSSPQTFNLTIGQAPNINSANNTTFTVGTPGSFTVTTDIGFPAPTFSETGALPTGVTFVNGVLSGTPAAGTGGSYPITIKATNGVAPDASQSFTLTVNQTPAITSAATTTFVTTLAGSFTVTATGNPTPTLSVSGAPGWLNFNASTGVLSTTAGTASAGNFTFTITADNGITPVATQSFTLKVVQPPTVTATGSSQATGNTVTISNLTVPTCGAPDCYLIVGVSSHNYAGTVNPVINTVTWNGAALTAINNAQSTTNGYRRVSFFQLQNPTPGASSPGVVVTGSTTGVNDLSAGAIVVSGVVTGGAASALRLGATTIASNTGAASPASVTITGGTSPHILQPGDLVMDLASNRNDNGSDTPGAGQTSRFQLRSSYNTSYTGGLSSTEVASGTSITMTWTLGTSDTWADGAIAIVPGTPANQAPSFTSAATTNFVVGVSGSFQVSANGYPAPSFSQIGAPAWVNLTSGGLLTGTPPAGSTGSYPFTITATNGISPNATQQFTLVVQSAAPSFTSLPSATFVAGTAGTFQVQASGLPAPTFSVTSGTLPTGVQLSTAGALTSTALTPAGTYPFTITASNTAGTATQNFTLTVIQTPQVVGSGSNSVSGSSVVQINNFVVPNMPPPNGDAYLIVGVSLRGGNVTSITWTISATGFTQTGFKQIGAVANGSGFMEIWALRNPSPGTGSIVVTGASNPAVTAIAAGAVVVGGVNVGGPSKAFRAFASNTGPSSPASVSVTSVTGDLVLDTVAVLGNETTADTAGTGQTKEWAIPMTGAVSGDGSIKPASSGSSTTMSWTVNGNLGWAMGAVSIVPYTGGPKGQTVIAWLPPFVLTGK